MTNKWKADNYLELNKLTICISSEKECVSYSNNIVYIQVEFHTTIKKRNIKTLAQVQIKLPH